jgi:hypothetical protein
MKPRRHRVKPVGTEELKDAILAMMVERFGDRPLEVPQLRLAA